MKTTHTLKTTLTDSQFDSFLRKLDFDIDSDLGWVDILYKGYRIMSFDMATESFVEDYDETHDLDFLLSEDQLDRIYFQALNKSKDHKYEIKLEQPEPRMTRMASGIL